MAHVDMLPTRGLPTVFPIPGWLPWNAVKRHIGDA
jgi:hypothetical protein